MAKAEDIKTVRLPLIGEMNNRGPLGTGILTARSTRDQFYQNCLFEELDGADGSKKYYVTKRPGYSEYYDTTAGLSASGGNPRLFYWKTHYFTVSGPKVFRDTTDLNITLANLFGITNVEPVGIDITHPLAATQYLGINDGVALYLVNTAGTVLVLNNVVVTSSSVANPSVITTATPHGLVSGQQVILRNHSGATPAINGTAYTVTVLTTTTFSIPLNVTVGGTGGTLGVFPANVGDLVYLDGYWFVIDVEGRIWQSDYNDPTVWNIAKYIINQLGGGEKSGIGLCRQNNVLVAFTDSNIQVFVDAANTSGSVLQNIDNAAQQYGCVYRGSIQSQEEATIWITDSRVGGHAVAVMEGLTGVKIVSNEFIQRILTRELRSGGVGPCSLTRIAGHKLYLIPCRLISQCTLVYNFGSNKWVIWTDSSGNSHFPLTDFFSAEINGSSQVLGIGNTGIVYQPEFNIDTVQDDGIDFPVVMQTRPLDFDTDTNKFVKSAVLVGDMQSTTTPVSLQYSDNDFLTLSTARTLDMADPHPMATSLGKFRRRGWRLSYTGPNPLRLESIQLKLRLGLD